jgi:hypothetical protein
MYPITVGLAVGAGVLLKKMLSSDSKKTDDSDNYSGCSCGEDSGSCRCGRGDSMGSL